MTDRNPFTDRWYFANPQAWDRRVAYVEMLSSLSRMSHPVDNFDGYASCVWWEDENDDTYFVIDGEPQ